jgi:6-phosphogluconolactonase
VSRRFSRAACGAIAAVLLVSGAFLAGPPAGADRAPLTVYVGTYTGTGSQGIYRFEFDPASGTAAAPALAATTRNPSFLALHPDGRVLYTVNEIDDYQGDKAGSVTAFTVDRATGALREIGRQSSRGADPCHLAVDPGGRWLLVANYNDGSVALLPLDDQRRPLPATVVLHHAGSGPNPERQKGPHAHAVLLDRGAHHLLSADLGADRLFVDRFDAAAGTLQANDPPAADLAPGSGPRHLAWHPSRPFLYTINELASTVSVFRYDPGRGALDLEQTIGALPPGFRGENTAAEVAASPDGRVLYTSNRGDDSLAVFAIDPATGRLSSAGRVASGGRTPRHFAIDPGGRWLLAANQNSDAIVVFRLDATTGLPQPTGESIPVTRPVCVLFASHRSGARR